MHVIARWSLWFSILLRRHYGHELVLGKSNLDWLTVKLHRNLSMFDRCIWNWYTNMEIIIPLYLSIELFWCSYNPMPLHSSSYGGVPILIPDSLRSTGSFGGLLFDRFYLFKNPWVLPVKWINFGESNPLFHLRLSTSADVPPASDVCRIGSLHSLMDGTYTSIICMNPETSTGHTLLVLRQLWIPTRQFHQNWEVYER